MPDVPESLRGERVIDVDQSNESVVVGERVVVKLYPRTAAGPQPGLELPAHLASVGFTALPRPLGAMTWTEDDGSDVLLVTAAAFLPGARDGWDWYLERLLAWLDGEADEEVAFGPAPEPRRLGGRDACRAGHAVGGDRCPRPHGRRRR